MDSVPAFQCHVFGEPWNQFVELWAPRIYRFVLSALGPYATEPLPDILAMDDASHAAGANASFNIMSGQIQLHPYMEGDPGTTLEKLTHEMTHGSLSAFPEGDPFYEEGFVDYSVFVMAHSEHWDPYRDAMVKAAAFNLNMRRKRAFDTRTDYDRKRWAGGEYAAIAHGPSIIATLRQRKAEGTLFW